MTFRVVASFVAGVATVYCIHKFRDKLGIDSARNAISMFGKARHNVAPLNQSNTIPLSDKIKYRVAYLGAFPLSVWSRASGQNVYNSQLIAPLLAMNPSLNVDRTTFHLESVNYIICNRNDFDFFKAITLEYYVVPQYDNGELKAKISKFKNDLSALLPPNYENTITEQEIVDDYSKALPKLYQYCAEYLKETPNDFWLGRYCYLGMPKRSQPFQTALDHQLVKVISSALPTWPHVTGEECP